MGFSDLKSFKSEIESTGASGQNGHHGADSLVACAARFRNRVGVNVHGYSVKLSTREGSVDPSLAIK